MQHNITRTDPSSKKKFDLFVADSGVKNEASDSIVAGIHEDKGTLTLPTPVIKTGSVNGVPFVSQFGALDCSIGSIFRDEFGKNLKMPKNSQGDQLGRALSVLIIDDSIIQRKLTMRTLGGLIDEVMWMVEGAENGECALNLIETSPRVPDVIIVDQYMESSGGLLLGHQVVAELRQNACFDSAVIVGCTGSAEEAAPLFLKAGSDVVWSKPMPSKDEAHAQIIALLQKRKNNKMQVTGGERLLPQSRSSPTSPVFTLENKAGFSNGVSSSTGSPPLDIQQPQASLMRPVFLQMHPASAAGGQSSYLINMSLGDRGSGSVFQFGTPPQKQQQLPVPVLSPRREEIGVVTEAISKINMTA